MDRTHGRGAGHGPLRVARTSAGATLDGKSDVYSLGLTLIEAVTGDVPFSADTTLGTLMARVERSVPVPESLGPVARAARGRRSGRPCVAPGRGRVRRAAHEGGQHARSPRAAAAGRRDDDRDTRPRRSRSDHAVHRRTLARRRLRARHHAGTAGHDDRRHHDHRGGRSPAGDPLHRSQGQSGRRARHGLAQGASGCPEGTASRQASGRQDGSRWQASPLALDPRRPAVWSVARRPAVGPIGTTTCAR